MADIQTNSLVNADAVLGRDLILQQSQLALLHTFRHRLRSCQTDADKFEVCINWRDRILERNISYLYFVAEIETIMLEECQRYKNKKLQGWRKTERDAKTWTQFVDTAREGDAFRRCLQPLLKVSHHWGKEKVQHYGWGDHGEKYCKVLGTAATTVTDWSEAVIKLNQLRKRRIMMMDGRRQLGKSNQIDQVDLENLKKWKDRNPYMKMKDPENVRLEYRALTVDDLPQGYGFDAHGLMVREEFSVPISSDVGQGTAHTVCPLRSAFPFISSADDSERENQNNDSIVVDQRGDTFSSAGSNAASMPKDITAQPCVGAASSVREKSIAEAVCRAAKNINTAHVGNISESSFRAITPTGGPRIRTVSLRTTTAGPITPANSDILSPITSDITTPTTHVPTSPCGDNLTGDDDAHGNGSAHSATALTSGSKHACRRRSSGTRSAPKPSYQGSPETKSRTQLKRRKATEQSLPRCRCSSKLPQALLQLLERDSDAVSYEANITLLQNLADYKDTLCLQHLKRLTKRALAAILYNGTALPEADTLGRPNRFDRTPSRRRASSVPDMADLPPAKKRQLTTSTLSAVGIRGANVQDQTNPSLDLGNGRYDQPFHNSAGDAQFHQLVLGQLAERIRLKSSKRNTWGELNDSAMLRLLSLATQPDLDGDDDDVDVYYLSGEAASARIENTTQQLRVPIVTCDQQQFRWTQGADRPIKQFFRWMEGLDQMVSVQMPSLNVHGPSYSRTRLSTVQRKLLGNSCANERWNLLDLACSLPGTLPNFLMGENCQLLSTVRNMALRGDTLDRTHASTEKWNEWKDVEHWALLAQAGALTLRHQDSHGFGTWITVQEGRIGFGWVSRPTAQELKAWMVDPVTYSGGKLRYVVLVPGQTVFIPSGVVHFVFRPIGQNLETFAFGGHILLWSSLDLWMEVILGQLRYPDITNEEMRTTVSKYVDVVMKLVSQRQRCRRVEELGGEERVAKFFALCEDFKKEISRT